MRLCGQGHYVRYQKVRHLVLAKLNDYSLVCHIQMGVATPGLPGAQGYSLFTHVSETQMDWGIPKAAPPNMTHCCFVP